MEEGLYLLPLGFWVLHCAVDVAGSEAEDSDAPPVVPQLGCDCGHGGVPGRVVALVKHHEGELVQAGEPLVHKSPLEASSRAYQNL